MNLWKNISLALGLCVLPAQSITTVQSTPPGTVPLYRISVVQGATKAINYRYLKGTTLVDFKGTAAAPEARGLARVKSREATTSVQARLENLPQAASFGGEYLTYVLWAISPEGRTSNLGELLVNKRGRGKLDVTTPLQSFGLVLTAEPYFAVDRPSNVVVAENIVRSDTKGKVEEVEARVELLGRGQYTLNLEASEPIVLERKTPFHVYQARNAVRIARAAGAATFAADAMAKAEDLLKQAEDPKTRGGKKGRTSIARAAVQSAQDARTIALKRHEEESLAQERREAQEKIEQARREVAQAAEAAERAEATRRKAERDRQALEKETTALRSQLQRQLNTVLQTRDTARGLIVNMSGVLFQTNKANLLPPAREKLAKIAGILLAHKGLKLEAEGYTDSTGNDTFNEVLSLKRAQSAREFLVKQGVAPDAITAKGFGKANPIDTNETPQGRQNNRRVELVVSGKGITELDK